MRNSGTFDGRVGAKPVFIIRKPRVILLRGAAPAMPFAFGIGVFPEVVMRLTTATFALFLFLASSATAQDPVRALIQRAVVAHGGLEKLSGVRADKVKLKGTLHIGSSAVPFTNELTIQAPEQFKSIVRISEG